MRYGFLLQGHMDPWARFPHTILEACISSLRVLYYTSHGYLKHAFPHQPTTLHHPEPNGDQAFPGRTRWFRQNYRRSNALIAPP